MIYWTAEGVHTCDVNRPLSQVVWTIYKFYKKKISYYNFIVSLTGRRRYTEIIWIYGKLIKHINNVT